MSEIAEAPHAPLNLAGDAIGTDAAGAPVLFGSQCGDCAAKLFPPAEVCPECMSENMHRLALASRGTLYSWSLVHAAPKGWTAPYIAAYVDLPDGVRVFAHIVDADPDRLRIDMAVMLCVRQLGIGEDGAAFTSYAFAPVPEGDG